MSDSADAKQPRWVTLLRLGIHLNMALAFAWMLYTEEWFRAFLILIIFSIMRLPARFTRRYGLNLPAEIEVLAVLFVFASLFLGEFGQFYHRYWWWDAILHIGSGVLLGLFGFMLILVLNTGENIRVHLSPGFACLFSFCFAVALGTLWEIFEFAMDSLVGTNMQKSGLVDTMWDLIVDSVGAGFVVALGYAYLRHGKRTMLVDWVEKFEDQLNHKRNKKP